MSFILEALKKSDSKRQDGTTPKLETVHSSGGHPRAKQPKWLWLLLFVLILNVVVLLWLFGPWHQQVSIALDTRPTVGPTIPPTLESPVEEIRPQPTKAPSATSATESPPTPSMPQPSVLPVESFQPTEKNRQQTRLASSTEKPMRKTALVTDQKKIFLIKNLPISVRRDLPEMHMSVHAFYSDKPSSRLVRINGQILRTGARLTNKYVLEEITSEGAVFIYAGYRFLVPRKNLRNK